VAFRKGGKNDTADAEAVAIAIAASQPTMRFVPIKSREQQAILGWHSMREGWKEERTALINRVRALLAEFGVVIARSADRLLAELPKLTEDARLPRFRSCGVSSIASTRV
jgi:transposase